MWAATGRLAILVACIGLATSRAGLVVHEFLGHGGTAKLVGGDVTDVHLFALAGGWIRYHLPAAGGELAIALGGIVVEAALGVALWLALARGARTLERRIVRAIGAALVVHAAWYLATGTWHGYGDGARLYRELGAQRWLVAVPAGALCVAAAYLGARGVLRALAATLPATGARRAIGALLAFAVAGALQLGGALAEVRLRSDATYAQTMRPERDRIVARELAAWEKEQLQRRAAIDAAERARKQAELAARAAVFPFAYVLGALVLAAIAIGGARGEGGAPVALARGLLVRWAALAAGSIAVVVAIDLIFH